jgi:predicted kinase
MKIKILQGVSGSGKSTWARKRQGLIGAGECVIVSADHYFEIGAEYKFDSSKLTQAHGHCFQRFLDYVERKRYKEVIVDNTNTTQYEIAPYILGAAAFHEYDIEILRFTCPIEVCAKRNKHGVSLRTIQRQEENFLKYCYENWPRHWPQPVLVDTL